MRLWCWFRYYLEHADMVGTCNDDLPRSTALTTSRISYVVGRSAHLPMFADAPQLPYWYRIVKEVLCWRPATERGASHKAVLVVEDDWYEGVFNVHSKGANWTRTADKQYSIATMAE